MFFPNIFTKNLFERYVIKNMGNLETECKFNSLIKISTKKYNIIRYVEVMNMLAIENR